jgi:hypothetical protein
MLSKTGSWNKDGLRQFFCLHQNNKKAKQNQLFIGNNND